MEGERDLSRGDRVGLQDGEGAAVLRSGEPEGPRVEEDGGPPEEGQDVPAHHRGEALLRLRQLRHLHRQEGRAHRHLLHQGLRVRRCRP